MPQIIDGEPAAPARQGAFRSHRLRSGRRDRARWALGGTPETVRRGASDHHLAEGVGFEPTRHFCPPVFKTGSIGRSDSPPGRRGSGVLAQV